MDTKRIPYKVLIDCTASDSVADRYTDWFKQGIHVISPNKMAAAGPLSRYHDCFKAMKASQTTWSYESTVGAQLPVISLIRDILQTGDRVTKIEGIVSGTLG